MAVHVVLAPGASEVAGQVTVPTLASAIATAVRVTLPVLATTNVYGTVLPAVLPVAVPACLSIVIAGVDAIAVSVESVADAGWPCGAEAETVAVLATCPASTSDWVSV